MFVYQSFTCEKVQKLDQKFGQNVYIGQESVFEILMKSAIWNTNARIEKYGQS